MSDFIAKVLTELPGEWILIGGALIPALGRDHRQTFDIDFLTVDKADNQSRIDLFKLCDSLGLPPEVINPAGEFFLKQMPGWRSDLLVLAQSEQATIFRPSFSTFINLKLGRASSADLEDIELFIEAARPSLPEATGALKTLQEKWPGQARLKSLIEDYIARNHA